jgi:iron complex outermembrane receptor protein
MLKPLSTLASSSALALVFAAQPLAAQTAAQTSADTAQQTPAAPGGATATTAADDVGTIVVTGFRKSLQSAQSLKKRSNQIVDAIVAEDIGKLPDTTVSDTAARIPGIQVERNGGEASRVLVRGLDQRYYATTYNSREIFTAETRSVALQDFPAGAIAAVEAYKTSAANLVEPGLAGLINVRSRRPFDFKGLQVAGSVWGVYGNQARDFKPNGQLLVSDRWKVGDGEFGALLNFSYTKFHYQDSVRRHGFFIANLAGGRSPDWPELHYNEGDRTRPSANGALQWRPSPNLEFYAEGLWQGYRENVSDRDWEQPLWNCGQAVYSNIVTRPGTNEIVSGTVTNPGCPNLTRGFQGATKRHTDTYQFAVGGSYDAGPLKITGDLARTDSKFKLRTESVDYSINTNQFTVNWDTGLPGGPGPTFEVVGLDFANPANYHYRGFFEDYLTAKGKDWQGRLDFEYEPHGIDFIPKISWGMRYVDRDALLTAGARYWDNNACCHPFTPISTVPLTYVLYQSAFHGDSHKPSPLTWLSPTFDSVWSNLTALRQFNINLLGYGSTDDPAIDPRRTYAVNEKSLAGYAQLNYKFDLGDVGIDGLLGVRAVRTRDRVSGTVFEANTAPAPITVNNKYTDLLPNASMTIKFSPQWQLRLAATKTRTRPQFDQLNPALDLGQPVTCSPSATNCVRSGFGGNPFLKPLKSDNYDASLEYYFSRTGFASLAGFDREMRGFIINRTFRYPTSDASGVPIEVTGPVNTNKARIRGFEAQVSTFFDWEWMPSFARSFGAQANVTYIDAKADTPLYGTDRRLPIPDVSKWTYNLVAMYEAHGLSARLSYNRRSSFPEGGLAIENDNTRQGRGNPVSRLDLSTNYDVNPHLTLFFDWTNILKKPYRSDIVRINYNAGQATGTEIFPLLARFEETVLSGGIRFRFGK